MSKIITLAPRRPARMSAKLRAALDAVATENASVTAACEKAGISRQGFHKAMKRAEVREYVDTARLRFVMQADGMRAYAKARAIEVALDLMMNSKNESIRARMAEFLASDAKVTPIAVHIDARQAQGVSTYSFSRPSSHVEGD